MMKLCTADTAYCLNTFSSVILRMQITKIITKMTQGSMNKGIGRREGGTKVLYIPSTSLENNLC